MEGGVISQTVGKGSAFSIAECKKEEVGEQAEERRGEERRRWEVGREWERQEGVCSHPALPPLTLRCHTSLQTERRKVVGKV